jgi:putative copper export protein/methionine-rich copper-binding protein CopC
MFQNPGFKAAAIGALSLFGSLAHAPTASAAPALSKLESTSESTSKSPTRPHTELISSDPADGDTLTSELEFIRLIFSGPVEEALSEIRLAGPVGLDLLLEARANPTMDRALLAAVPPLTPGAYRVAWRTVSVDGHAVSGSFVFFVPVKASAEEGETRTSDEEGAAADRAAAVDETEPAADAASRFEPPPAETDALGIGVPPSLALSRGAAVATLLALGGLLAIIVWVAPGESRRASKLAYLLALLLPVLLIGHLFFWLRSVSPGDTLDLEAIPALMGTRAGGLELLRLGLAVAALATLAFGRHLGSAAFLTLLATLVSGATGHALSTDPAISVPAKAAHLAATQYWLGGLVYLIVEAKDSPEYRTTAQRISRIAVFAVITIAGTGIIQTLAALPAVTSVFTTTYGRLVLAKTAGLIVLGLFGFRNQFSLLPALEEEMGAGKLRRSVMWEILVMAVIFVLAALLAYVPPTA